MPLERQRWCFWVNPSQTIGEMGFVPSVVIDGEPGHRPLTGDGSPYQLPWFWGKTYREAMECCATENAKRGLSMEEVDDILLSSMLASRRGEAFSTTRLPSQFELRS